MQYDVIIVGAGPAGAYAAYKLAQENLKVLLIEQQKLPRYKSCGGAVSLKTTELLSGLDLTPVLEDKISYVEFAYQFQAPIKIDFTRPFVYLVMRDQFDHFLVNKAQAAGVKVITDTKVTDLISTEKNTTVITPQTEFRTQFVIGADGVNSLVATKLGLTSTAEPAVGWEKEIKVPAQQLNSYRGKIKLDYGTIPQGYSWIFPKQDHLSVGIATYKHGFDLKHKLQEYLVQEDLSSYQELTAKGHLLPVWQTTRKLNTNSGLLIGDAAGLVDPLSGEGIFYALKSAQLASKTILDILQGSNTLTRYTTAINQQLVPEFKQAKLLTNFFFFAPEQIHRLLTTKEWILEELLEVIYGLKSYNDLYKSFISEIPFLKHIVNK
ncbi:NAD(P)/FAD-dependent oxidoreductase [Halanaerobaculum tunisiense]